MCWILFQIQVIEVGRSDGFFILTIDHLGGCGSQPLARADHDNNYQCCNNIALVLIQMSNIFPISPRKCVCVCVYVLFFPSLLHVAAENTYNVFFTFPERP